jgi:hypothetical protein
MSTANGSRPYDVPITLDDGVPRTLRYTWAAVRRMRQHGLDFLGMDKAALAQALEQNFDVVLWAGLAWQDQALTPELAGELVGFSRTNDVLALVMQAMMEASTPEVPEARADPLALAEVAVVEVSPSVTSTSSA